MMNFEDELFVVGEPVVNTNSDYVFDGVVVASFTKVNGYRRYAVENRDRLLHIFSAKQLRSKLGPKVLSAPDVSGLG